MKIRKATLQDLDQIYKLGKNAPELKVSNKTEFSSVTELENAINWLSGVFLIAEQGSEIIGFLYANTTDFEVPLLATACLVYIVIKPEFRQQKIGQQLYDECEKILKARNIKTIYCWANLEGNGEIINFMQKNGFETGHKYIWMDKEL
jgi:N-acetylglutamate synthase-like GNAT family acetyltransferase